MRWNQVLEDAIFGRVLTCLLDHGFRVEVSDQDGGGLFFYAATNGGMKPKTGYSHWVRFAPGRGPNVISDYTVNLEAVIRPALDLANLYAD